MVLVADADSECVLPVATGGVLGVTVTLSVKVAGLLVAAPSLAVNIIESEYDAGAVGSGV